MAQHLYVTGAEHGSGKSLVALALADLAVAAGERIGLFRPVAPQESGLDPLTELVVERFRLEAAQAAAYGVTAGEARELVAADRYPELLKRVLERFRGLAGACDRVLCVGTDFASVAGVLEFEFNIDAANNLGCLLVPVVRGHHRGPAEIVHATRAFLELLEDRGGDVLGTFVNRVPPAQLAEAEAQLARWAQGSAPFFLIPEEPTLSRPTMGDIAAALNARILYGDENQLSREIHDYKIAAMRLPNFLDHLGRESLVMTPGDRDDVILGSLMAHLSTAYPQIAGVLCTGGLEPSAQVRRLMEGLGDPPVAVLSVDSDTFGAAMEVHGVSAALSAGNERRVAAALGLFEGHVDRSALRERIAASRSTRVTPIMFEYDLLQRARQQRHHIVLPEGEEERILRAAEILWLRGVVDITLLGDPEAIRARIDALDLHLGEVQILDPLESAWRAPFAECYYELRKHKGISREMAADTITDVSYFGTLMVHLGHADGMVSGSVHTTQHTIRPAFEIIKTRPGTGIVSSVFFMCLEDRVLVYGDCAVNPNPTAEQLADIALSSADTAAMFGVEPRVAMLSYSTGESGKGDAVEKVRIATELARRRRPDLQLEGPMQYDAAVDAGVARTKLPDSAVAGNATVFIFPDLNTGNNTYKAVQRSAGAVAVGPVLQGLNKPVNDLSRGCTVTDIVNTVAITAIQAQRQTALP
jgi:phosphate acetyltransferase